MTKEGFIMSTSTPSPDTQVAAQDSIRATTGSTLQGWLLVLLVFVAGSASLAVELSASRLLAPYFGTSLFVWANLIGLILLYLTIGYSIGGRVADRYPRPALLYLLTTAAAFLIGLIPFIARPILDWSLAAFATYSIGVFYGSLVAVIFLFAIPMILLGCVSPFAIRLRVEQVGKSGRTAGQLYAISTAGSILGTFLPVLWLIPTYGTYRTFLIFALSLLLISFLGLLVSRAGGSSRRPRLPGHILPLFLLIPLGLATLGTQGPIKPADGTSGGGVLLTERESPYNYIQVVRVGTQLQLVLNEGLGVHSVYDPDSILTQGPWDYFLVAPYFNNPPYTPPQVHRVAILGLGAGTIPREFSAAYGPIPIDGVEIDGTIVQLGREYFHMDEPNLHVIVQDGRYYLRSTARLYDVIGIDAYQQPYVPFQMTTVEFFREVRSHLTSQGVAVVNAGRTCCDFRLVNELAQTMRAAFPNVYIIDSQNYDSSLVIGTRSPTQLGNFVTNTKNLANPLLRGVAAASIAYGHIREEKTAHVYFTDDRAPVEQLIDQIIFDAAVHGGR
jgi:predicted membrane-bound spermidine synthase